MENMQIPREFQQEYYTEVNRMGSKIYDKVMPYIQRAVDNLDDNMNLTNDDINNLTNSIIAESNIMMSPPEHHNRETIFDTIKMLLIMELEDMDSEDWEDGATPAIVPFGFDPGFRFFPPFFFPFFFGGRRRRRRRRRRY